MPLFVYKEPPNRKFGRSYGTLQCDTLQEAHSRKAGSKCRGLRAITCSWEQEQRIYAVIRNLPTYAVVDEFLKDVHAGHRDPGQVIANWQLPETVDAAYSRTMIGW